MDLTPLLLTLFSDHTQVRASGGRKPEQGCSNHSSEMALGMPRAISELCCSNHSSEMALGEDRKKASASATLKGGETFGSDMLLSKNTSQRSNWRITLVWEG